MCKGGRDRPLHSNMDFFAVGSEHRAASRAHRPCVQSSAQPASLLSEAAASSQGNLLQAPSLIIRELLPSDSLGSFLSLPLHACPLIQPTSRAAVSQHLSQMEDSSSLQIFLGWGDTTVTQWISSFFANLSVVIISPRVVHSSVANLFYLFSQSTCSSYHQDVERDGSLHGACLIIIVTIPFQLHPRPQ